MKKPGYILLAPVILVGIVVLGIIYYPKAKTEKGCLVPMVHDSTVVVYRYDCPCKDVPKDSVQTETIPLR